MALQVIFLYGSECWTSRKQNKKRILTPDNADMSRLEKIARISRTVQTKMNKKEFQDKQTTVLDTL